MHALATRGTEGFGIGLLLRFSPRVRVRTKQAAIRRGTPQRTSFSVHARAGWDLGESKLDMVDYFEVLGVGEEASLQEIKKAYYGLAKECHPDYLGDSGHEACILLNEAYDTLSNVDSREWYTADLRQAKEDLLDGFTGKPRSKWRGSEEETRAVFVDECTCIGCKNCVWAAPATFRLEPTHGRSYVFGQWLNNEDELQCAIDSCPVDCIHWVDRQQLPVLEFVMASVDRVSVGVMMAGQGAVTDPFAAAVSYSKLRDAKIKARAKKAERKKQSETVMRARKNAAEMINKRREDWLELFKRREKATWTVPPERSIVPYVETISEEKSAEIEYLLAEMVQEQGKHGV